MEHRPSDGGEHELAQVIAGDPQRSYAGVYVVNFKIVGAVKVRSAVLSGYYMRQDIAATHPVFRMTDFVSHFGHRLKAAKKFLKVANIAIVLQVHHAYALD